MSQNFYLSSNGEHLGPFAFEAVLKRVKSKETAWTDYVFDEQQGEWLLLIDHPLFAKHVPKEARAPKEKSFISDNYTEKAWFVLKQGNNYGPFSQVEVIQMLQERNLHEFDYVWHQQMPSWKKISEVETFAPERIRSLQGKADPDLAEVFFRRRHARAKYGCSLIVHNNKKVFSGESMEISVGGAGILLAADDIQPGQDLFLHFKPGDGVPPFNALCQVVSRQVLKDSGKVRYGVKFTSISQVAKESIKTYAVAKAA